MKDTKLKHGKNAGPTMLDPASAAVMIAMLSKVDDIGNRYKGIVAVKPENPLKIDVLKSGFSNGHHNLKLAVTNLGSHGVYIEKIQLLEPAECKLLLITKVTEQEVGLTIGDQPRNAVPVFIPANSPVYLRISISQFQQTRFDKKPYGRLKYFYTVAGIAKPSLNQEFDFVVRNKSESGGDGM